MQVRMQNAEELNREQVGEFLRASEGIEFQGQNRAETYAWVQRVLVGREYASRGKRECGEIRAYLSKVTGLSLPQVTRLIRMYRETGTIGAKRMGGGGLPRNTPPRMWRCWRKWIVRTRA